MKKYLYTLLITFAAITHSHVAQACSCGSEIIGAAGLGAPIITVPAYTLPKGRFAIGTGIQYLNVDAFSDSKLRRLNRRRAHTHSFDDAMSIFVNAAYGVTDDLDLMISYPYNITNNIKTTFTGITIDEGDSAGFGDMTLMAKYKFLKLEKYRLYAAALGGIKIPTGERNETNEFGFRLGADDQPGTGSWDPVMGLALSKQFDNFSLDTNGLYRLSTQGSQDTVVGDLVNFNVGISYHVNQITPNKLEALIPQRFLGLDLDWNLVLEMNGIWEEKVATNEIKDDSHGGLTIFLSPGIRMAVEENWIANLSIGLPIIEDLNGDQPDTQMQLLFSINRIF